MPTVLLKLSFHHLLIKPALYCWLCSVECVGVSFSFPPILKVCLLFFFPKVYEIMQYSYKELVTPWQNLHYLGSHQREG